MAFSFLIRSGGARMLPTRGAGAMMLAGGSLGAVSVALPPAAPGSDLAILGLCALALALGLALSLTGAPASSRVLGAVVALGTGLIAVATEQGGSVGTGTADNEVLFLWPVLFAFNFFSLRHALAQLALIGIAYAWLLQAIPLDEAATRYLVTLGTLLVAGALVARLRQTREEMLTRLTRQARHDSLTGALNRGELENRAVIELARARRQGLPISVLVVDIDDLKALNDQHGHHAGDDALRNVAHVLEAMTRETDAVARLGGDEFAVLLPGADRRHAGRVADRIVAEARGGAGLHRVTLSVGWATRESFGHDLNGLLAAADAAMYRSKRAGGDAATAADERRAAGAI